MKKAIFLLTVLLTMYGVQSMAESLSMPSMQIKAGQEFTLPIALSCEQDYTAFLMDLKLPDGIQLASENPQEAVTYASEQTASSHLLMIRRQANGELRLAGYSLTNDTLRQTSDVLINVRLKVCDTLAAGHHEVRIERAVLTTPQGKDSSVADAVCLLSVPARYAITAIAQPAAGGTVSGAGIFDAGTETTLTATPNANYVFGGWTDEQGEAVSDMPQITHRVERNVVLTAHFTQVKEVLVHDTTVVTVHDTAFVTLRDTILVSIHDTVTVKEPLEIHDTLYVSDMQRVEPPTFSLSEDGMLSISCVQTAAAIFYTTDGLEPTESSTRYTAPFALTGDMTVKAIAIMRSETSDYQTSSLDRLQKSAIATQRYYDISGRTVGNGRKGLKIKSTTYADGRKKVIKQINNSNSY